MTKNELALWNDSTWSPLAEWRREMDRLFEESQFVPACDVEEEEDHYLLTLEVPGISKEDLKIEVLENHLVVSGERKGEKKSRSEGARYTERRFGKFQRSFSLPAGIDKSKIDASYQDGVLWLALPKAESAKPRQVKIRSGSPVLDKIA